MNKLQVPCVITAAELVVNNEMQLYVQETAMPCVGLANLHNRKLCIPVFILDFQSHNDSFRYLHLYMHQCRFNQCPQALPLILKRQINLHSHKFDQMLS